MSGAGLSPRQWLDEIRALLRQCVHALVVLQLFSGELREGEFEDALRNMADQMGIRVHITSVDMCNHPDWDLTDPQTMSIIMEGVEEGLVDLVLAGPPCSTWSRARFRPGGPRPVPHRSELAWGLPGLTPSERSRVNVANQCAVNSFTIAEGVSSRGGSHVIEHPRGPGGDPYPSIWAAPEMTGMEERVRAERFELDQCM
eukprot:2409890-Heterocapsa_arctica.AAC.1